MSVNDNVPVTVLIIDGWSCSDNWPNVNFFDVRSVSNVPQMAFLINLSCSDSASMNCVILLTALIIVVGPTSDDSRSENRYSRNDNSDDDVSVNM